MRNRYLAPLAVAASATLGGLLGCSPSTPAQPDQPGSAAQPTTSSPPAGGTTGDPAPKVTADDAAMRAAAQGDTEFAVHLYSKVRGEGNTLLSPASARLALMMAYAGAKGATAEQMARVLAVPDDPGVHDAFGAILGLWGSWANVEVPSFPEAPSQPFRLRVANRLFGQTGRPFVPAYLAVLSDKYAAPLEQVDFKAAPDPARRHINQWVSEKTEDRIQDLLPAGSIQNDTRLVLVNAIYFKADWLHKFDKGATRDLDFFAPTGAVKVPAMTQTKQLGYAETESAQILEMGYLGAPVAMTVILPKDRDGLSRLEEGLTPAALAGWIGAISPARVTVQIPKLKIESTFRLSEALASLGMTDALDARKADFSGMDGTRELFIGEVIQKTFCAVDEDGTEAAAATAVIMRAGSAAQSGQPKSFIADHPFLFLIRDTQTGSILFMGRVLKP